MPIIVQFRYAQLKMHPAVVFEQDDPEDSNFVHLIMAVSVTISIVTMMEIVSLFNMLPFLQIVLINMFFFTGLFLQKHSYRVPLLTQIIVAQPLVLLSNNWKLKWLLRSNKITKL